jgi:hypothetical protein
VYRKPVTVLYIAPLGRGERLRTALGLVLTALNADVVFSSMSVTGNDRDPDGEIIGQAIIEQLQEIVVDLDGRALALRCRLIAHRLTEASLSRR